MDNSGSAVERARHAVVLGGAGFLGSHLVDRLLADGLRVTAIDSLLTGQLENLAHLDGQARFAFIEANVDAAVPVDGAIDFIFHFASPASPPAYLAEPLVTLRAGSTATFAWLDVAREHNARFFMASTSEVYGDPLVNPQPETYWGNVNPIGPRSVYDEAKRFSEAATMAYRRTLGVDTTIVRIFNTYGPRMRFDDGRAVPNFIMAALAGEPMPIHGDGSQTRSLCYVDDLIAGIVALAMSDHSGPMNIGNPHEMTIEEVALAIAAGAGVEPDLEYHPRPEDDPSVRRPDISLAREVLGWEPKVSLEVGLRQTIDWFRSAR
jgi:dTDP-glucose 4,6-dehydratase